MSPLKLTLWCWLCSKDFRHWNQIEVAEDKTIMHIIKLVTPLLPADAIPNVNVFKPRGRINCDKYLVDTLGGLTCSKLKEPLSYTRKLSGLVDARTPKDSLHLIIDYHHPLWINFWFRGGKSTQTVEFEIQSNSKVGWLKDLIKNREPQLRHIPNSYLQLYLISSTISDLAHDLEKVLATSGRGDLLDESQTVSEALKDVPFKMFTAKIWVVIEVASPYTAIQPPSPNTDVHPVKAAREKFLTQHCMMASSDTEVPLSFRKRQERQGQGISCTRFCSSCETIPLALLHPVFGEFADDCWSGESTMEDLKFAQRFADMTLLTYQDEKHCREEISKASSTDV